MVVACKSDPEETLAVQPLEGNEIGAPFNIGLVELSAYMPQGKHKMRMSFGWLLKAVSKERRAHRPPQVTSPANDDQRLRATSAAQSPASNDQSHEWHHPVERKPLSDGSAEPDLVIRRTQSQGAVRSLQTNSTAARMRQQGNREEQQAESNHQPTLGQPVPVETQADVAANGRVTEKSEVTAGQAGSITRREKPPPISVVTDRQGPQKHAPL